ncbi:MAG: hypothetical protein ABJX82_18605 [Paracoccaceae bacterium]
MSSPKTAGQDGVRHTISMVLLVFEAEKVLAATLSGATGATRIQVKIPAE